MAAPPGSFMGEGFMSQRRGPSSSSGRVTRPTPIIEPGFQQGESRSSLGVLQPPMAERQEPRTFPNSPELEGRRSQPDQNFSPGFGSFGTGPTPFNPSGNPFEGSRNDRRPILPVRPPNSPPLRPRDLEESIPPPPTEETDQFGGGPLRPQNPSFQSGPDPNGPINVDPNPRVGNQQSRVGGPDSNIGQPNGRGPILPVRPPNRGGAGQNWNISDAEAAGLINGEDLNASQEGRCVVCGPRNEFETVDPVAAQQAIGPNQIPGASYEDETEALIRGGGGRPMPGRLPKDMFPNPEELRLGDLAEIAVSSLIHTCRTKLDCKGESFEARQKLNDIHRIELEMQRKYKPFESPSAVARRLSKIHMVKRFILNVAGLAEHVIPTNDGTFQQDVLLTEDQAEYLLHKLRIPIHGKRPKRAAIYMEQMPSQIWDLGQPIPYTFDLSMNERDRNIVQAALRSIELYTCIRFVEYPIKPAINHIYYVKIDTPTFCGLSYVGKISPANPIYLSFQCGDPIGVAVHETMHALGVVHEHLRVDRDKYLQMQWDNINPQFLDYFAIGDPLSFTSYGVPFDFESIMMYGPFTGAVDPSRPSIRPLHDDGTKLSQMGQRKKLSKADILLLNRMYCRPPHCVDRNVFCGTWSLRGLCVGAPQSYWMQKHCRRSCNIC